DMSQYRSLHLLNTQGLYLNLEEILYLLPDEWPLQVIEGFLTQAFRKATENRLQGKIALGLSRGENLMVSFYYYKYNMVPGLLIMIISLGCPSFI
ncbi:hypothetical protein INT43_003299, partial [Umbelopsis isabellina]